MFAYGTEVLHLSEAEAYLRISAARASREHPMLLTMLADGRLHLTAIAKLAPHLTRENRDELLERATHRSKRQIEDQIAEIAPRPDVPVMVRKLPERRTLPTAGPLVVSNRGEGLGQVPILELRPDGVAAPHTEGRQDPPSSASVVQPLSPGRYKVQFTASAELHHKLEPSPRSSNGSRLVAWGGRELPAGVPRRCERHRRARLPPPATSPRPSSAPCVSATETNAATWTSRVDDASSATTSNSTIGTRSAWGATTRCRTSG